MKSRDLNDEEHVHVLTLTLFSRIQLFIRNCENIWKANDKILWAKL